MFGRAPICTPVSQPMLHSWDGNHLLWSFNPVFVYSEVELKPPWLRHQSFRLWACIFVVYCFSTWWLRYIHSSPCLYVLISLCWKRNMFCFAKCILLFINSICRSIQNQHYSYKLKFPSPSLGTCCTYCTLLAQLQH